MVHGCTVFMNLKSRALLFFAVVAILSFPFEMQANHYDFPRLPGAELLTGYPTGELAITTPSSTLILQKEHNSLSVLPSMSRNGAIIAASQSCGDVTVTLATYSAPDKTWHAYTTLQHYGYLAIAPDGSKMAYATSRPYAPGGVRIFVIDLKTGTETSSPVIGHHAPVGLSWSPDGNRIAFGISQSPYAAPDPPVIKILEVATGKSSTLAAGQMPAWSPSGEWIAYLDPDRANHVLMVHPDGTGGKTLATLGGDRIFHDSAPIVWSPDSTRLLLNELGNADTYTFKIHLLDIATLKLKTKFRNTVPVFGWVDLK